MTKISVITVVLNKADYLGDTIHSVLSSKNNHDIDHIIIDGGSTDGTVDLLNKYSGHLYYWASEPDLGIYDAINKGWRVASDDSLILILGAGDRLLALPENNEFITNNTVVYGEVQVNDDEYFIPYSNWRLRYYNSLHHQGLLVPKSVHPEAPFNIRYQKYADFDFNQRLYRLGARFCYDPNFKSYAMPGGVTGKFSLAETVRITLGNFGATQAALTILAYFALRCIPPLRRLRPYVQGSI